MDAVISRALMYAMEKHAGQTYPRKDGVWPYITHPIRVALRIASSPCDPIALVVALLHDVVEDTDATTTDIRARFGSIVSEAVSKLSRKDGVPYKEYIRTLAKYPVACMVKIADVQDNLHHCSNSGAPDFTKSLIGRYVWALEYLMDSTEESLNAAARGII